MGVGSRAHLLLEEVGMRGLHVPAVPVRQREETRAQRRWGDWWKEQQARVRLLGQVSPLLSAQASYMPLGLSVTTCEMGVVEAGGLLS